MCGTSSDLKEFAMNKLNVGDKVMLLTASVDEGALGLYDPVLNLDAINWLAGTITALPEGDGEQLYEVEIADGTNTYYSDYPREFIFVRSDLSRLQTTFDRLLKEIT
jgi:hypothetical protein